MNRTTPESAATLLSMPLLTTRTWVVWRTLQLVVWIVGLAIFVLLIVAPDIGIHAFWNVLIPVAPALVAFAPGLWRNICPLGSTALFAQHMGLSARRQMPPAWQGSLALIGVVLLLLIVPLRHVVLDTNGPATALTIALLAVIAVLLGTQFQWKSSWCSGMCPVHPVEKLYGSEPMRSWSNVHCHRCQKCVVTCPDSVRGVSPLVPGDTGVRRVAGVLMVGGFAGFIWGWFHVPDYAGVEGWQHLARAYGLPFAGLAVTLAAYLLLERLVPEQQTVRLRRLFAAAAISCYYWYRLPALFGFGPFPGDGMLVDLRHVLPEWFPVVSRIATTTLLLWWLVWRCRGERSWLVRPPFLAGSRPQRVAV